MAKRQAPRGKTQPAPAPTPEPKRSRIGSVAKGTVSLGVLAAGIFGLTRLLRRAPDGAEHVPTDLLGEDRPSPEDRAPVAFRPDPTASIPASERDAFRPALEASTR